MMKYYRDLETGDVYAYEADGSQDDFIKEGLMLMTDKEVYAYYHPPITPEQRLATNTAARAELSNTASIAMTPLLMGLQLGSATDDDTVKAKAWQAYYRLLNLVDLTVESPDWPAIPE